MLRTIIRGLFVLALMLLGGHCRGSAQTSDSLVVARYSTAGITWVGSESYLLGRIATTWTDGTTMDSIRIEQFPGNVFLMVGYGHNGTDSRVRGYHCTLNGNQDIVLYRAAMSEACRGDGCSNCFLTPDEGCQCRKKFKPDGGCNHDVGVGTADIFW